MECPSCGKEVDLQHVHTDGGCRFIGYSGCSWDFTFQLKPPICFECKMKTGDGIRAAMIGDMKYLTVNRGCDVSNT